MLLFQGSDCNSTLSQTTKSNLDFAPTSTFGPGPERWPGSSGSSIQRSGEQNADLILGVRVQVANLVVGLVHWLQVVHGAGDRAVLHLPIDDRPVPVDAVSIQLDPEVGGTNCC